MADKIPARLRRQVMLRAGGHCEYCLMPESFTLLALHVDHIIARKHGGQTTPANLALACADCNWAKGSDIAALDPDGGEVIALFNPRTDIWGEHFIFGEGKITGLTPKGRATAQLLNFNTPQRIRERNDLAALGVIPFFRQN